MPKDMPPPNASPQFSSKVARLRELEQECVRLRREIELEMIAAAPKVVVKKERVPGTGGSRRRDSWIDNLIK